MMNDKPGIGSEEFTLPLSRYKEGRWYIPGRLYSKILLNKNIIAVKGIYYRKGQIIKGSLSGTRYKVLGHEAGITYMQMITSWYRKLLNYFKK